MNKAPKLSTPWGQSQHVKHIADGILFVSTSSHGGIQLSPERIAAMRSKLTFVPDNWLHSEQWWEEDCDIAIPTIVFHEHFEARAVFHAYRHVEYAATEGRQGAEILAWANSEPELLRKVEEYQEILKSHWQTGSMWTHEGKWCVRMRKADETKTVLMAEYPSKSIYSDAEVSAMPIA